MLKAGKDVDSYCGKCKMMLAHVIHAMVETRPARVECKTCGAIHAYKGHLPGEGPAREARSTSAPRRAAPKLSPREHFDTLIAGHDISSAQAFNIKTCFEIEGIVNHSKFGLGLVTKVLDDKKIEVTFQDAVRVLVHDRG